MRYWLWTFVGLAVCGAAIVSIDWGLYHLVRTGTCASGGPYVSARPCPPGTGLHIVALVGGIFGAPIGMGMYAARGGKTAEGTVSLGTIMWALLFCTLAGSAILAAYGPAHNVDDPGGARIAALVLGFVFIPMGLAPVLFMLVGKRAGRVLAARDGVPLVSSRIIAPPPAVPRIGDDRVTQLERLGRLRDQGVLSADEFERAKQKLLGT